MREHKLTPEQRVAEIASKYDNEEGDLLRSTLAALARRQADSGKVCARCDTKKALSAFGPDARKGDGLQSTCRVCEAERARDARRTA